MNPLLGLAALYSLNRPATGGTDSSLTAYALPAWGWMVIRLPWDMWIVIGNDCGFNTNAKSPTSVFQKRYGTDPVALTAEGKFKSYLAGGTLTPREMAQANWWAVPRLISAKWRGSVWALDEHNNIATVDKGHFLGKALQGTPATCSALISTLLQQPGANLDPLQSAVVGGRQAHTLHHGRVPLRAHKWREVLHFLDGPYHRR